MYVVLLLNLLTLSINIDNNTKLFMGNYYISQVLLSPKYAFVGKDVNVFEHDKLSKFTKIHIKVTEEPFYCCSTFHGYNSVFNNKVTTGSSVIRSVFHNLYKKKYMKTWLTNYTVTCKIQFNFRSNHIPDVNTHEHYIIPDVNTHEYYIIPDVNAHEYFIIPDVNTYVLYYP